MPSDCPVSRIETDKRGYESRRLGRYMVAVEQPRLLGEPNRWHVRMKRGGAVLGIIAWCFSWKKYVFQPVHMAEFSADCLATLAAFLEQLEGQRKMADAK